MTDDYVQAPADGAGKKLQTFSNVVGANTVHAEAMTPVDSAGTELALATEATLGTVHGHVDSIDGKITACNTGAVTISGALPTGTNSIGSMTQSTKHDSKTYATVTVLTASSGNNTIVAAVSGKVCKVHALSIQAEGTVTILIQNGAGGATLDRWSFQVREGAVKGFASAPACWFQTSQNTLLNMNLSAAIQTQINVIYSVDDAS